MYVAASQLAISVTLVREVENKGSKKQAGSRKQRFKETSPSILVPVYYVSDTMCQRLFQDPILYAGKFAHYVNILGTSCYYFIELIFEKLG
jgi:hypothetical protein